MDRRQPTFPALLLLSTCVSVSPTSSGPPPPPPPPHGPFADFAFPDSATGAVATIEAALAAPVYQSLATFAPSLSIVGGHAPVPVSPIGALRCAGGDAPLAGAVGPSGVGQAAIPDSVLSHVFAYDSVTQSFTSVADSGGPKSGVRFLLAQVDSMARPVFPLTTVGWLDVIDHSPAGSLDSLGAVLVGQGVPLLDYSLAPTGTSSTYARAHRGHVYRRGIHVLVSRLLIAAGHSGDRRGDRG